VRDNPKSVPGFDATRDQIPGASGLSGTMTASADDQLHTTRQLLIYTLRYSRIFPAETTDDWVDGLCGLDAGAPEAGRAILAELREGYEWAKRQFRPDGTMATPGATSGATGGLGAGVFFDREVGEIDSHLDFLEALLDQAEAWLDAPGGADGV